MRKTISVLLTALLLAALLIGCAANPETPADPTETGPAPEAVALTEKIKDCSLHLEAVDGIGDDFIFGMDCSQVPSLEQSGVKFYGWDGKEQDVFLTLAQSGVNYIRVRVWNDPYDAEGRGYGGGNCTVETALEIGKRVTAYGMKLLVDFHYSDFWADPGKQRVPKAWEGMDLQTKAAALEQFTRESLQTLKNAGVDVGMVQVGNETTGSMCGESTWENAITLMKAGAKAIREVYPEAKIAAHFTNPENKGSLVHWAQTLQDAGLDYDVFATSYYPYWHGTLANLTQSLSDVKATFGKQVMVMETSYAYTSEDTDFSGNTISVSNNANELPYTVLGQATSVRNVMGAVAQAGGIGVCYWEGTWITVGTSSKTENEKLWEQFGSGWATKYAGDYDPDAGKWYGGSAVDNQAMFDASGHPLESLLVFALAKTGNEGNGIAAVTPTEAEPADPVDDAENLLQNGGFETGEDTPWVVENLTGLEHLYPEEKTGDSRTGDWHYHFWSPDADMVEFTLEQTPEGLISGSYDYRIYIMGGDCGDCEVYAYAKLDGEICATVPMEITVWNEWHLGLIEGIEYREGQTLTVGIYVKAPAAGAWGKIDDASLILQ